MFHSLTANINILKLFVVHLHVYNYSIYSLDKKKLIFVFEKSPECFKTFRIIFVTTNFWRLATSLQKEQFMVFLAAAVSFQQFLQNTTSYCDAPSSPLLECSNLSMMEGGQFPLQDFSISRWDDGERGQKCDFLLGAQQAEAGAGFKWSSTMQQKSLPAEQQRAPAATNLEMKYARRPLLAKIKFTRCTHASIW